MGYHSHMHERSDTWLATSDACEFAWYVRARGWASSGNGLPYMCIRIPRIIWFLTGNKRRMCVCVSNRDLDYHSHRWDKVHICMNMNIYIYNDIRIKTCRWRSRTAALCIHQSITTYTYTMKCECATTRIRHTLAQTVPTTWESVF